ncbi:hypothetical protein QQS21_007391 [Conoideocrella luteorostrata]|uniref:Calcineurin-like phosphoesterase domain-containing protein n=1 Tax=Conoideocrella luteorostrata TaxID=1105319 RepID=A0AAJ0CNM8_9HYPO|nr:hypothetical protein QQS21_007391 [Conoideocrella luteorostrata]
MLVSALERFGLAVSNLTAEPSPSAAVHDNQRVMVVTDLTISASSPTDPFSSNTLEPRKWHCVDKELYLHTGRERAWLYIAVAEKKDLTASDLVISDIRVGEYDPSAGSDPTWDMRPGGVWVLKRNCTDDIESLVTGVDVLFGTDAVDPRPEWTLKGRPSRASLYGTARQTGDQIYLKRNYRSEKMANSSLFRSPILMVTGVGVCNDAIDASGCPLPESEADPLTVRFLGGILDAEKPDLVLLTGDQLHHDIPDSQTTLFKVVAPMIERSIPYAAVFGNHDDEGTYAMSRATQMELLQDLPFSLCQPGPEQIDGVGNYYLQIFDRAPSKRPLSTLYLLDSHGQISDKVPFLGYSWIKQSQIDWFTATSRALRQAREKDSPGSNLHMSMAFFHIPFPEYGDRHLVMRGGHRREPTEGPKLNSHFYDALSKEGIVAVGCGHDHVNDFCGSLPDWKTDSIPKTAPWLCYTGGSGFGGYCSYGENRYYRRVRVWELDTTTGSIKTWKRVEYNENRVDELTLVHDGAVVPPSNGTDQGTVTPEL